MDGQAGHNTHPHAMIDTLVPGHECRNDLTTSVALMRKLRRLSVCLVYCFDMLTMDVCSTRHYETPGCPVQELNVCTILILMYYHNINQ